MSDVARMSLERMVVHGSLYALSLSIAMITSLTCSGGVD